MKRVIFGLMLILSTIALADRVVIIEETSHSALESSVNRLIQGKKVKNVSITMSSSNHGLKTMYYVACITYED